MKRILAPAAALTRAAAPHTERRAPVSLTRIWVSIVLLFCVWCSGNANAENASPNGANADAIAEVAAGTRTTANSSWWGFNPEDATESIQGAIDSKASTVIVPYMGAPWIVRPIKLRSNLELVFEPGVLVLAKAGEFKGKGDSLFTAQDCQKVGIRGYGATLRMRKKDYQSDAYEKAEWRMGIAARGCTDLRIEGLRIESTGGDGIYIGATSAQRWCENVHIKDCVLHDNHRQGISVITAVNLTIENCMMSATSGTAPKAGIDFEPNGDDERLENCLVKNCVFEDNAGSGILVYLGPMKTTTPPISIRFEDCHVRMGTAGMSPEDVMAREARGEAGITIGGIRADGVGGLIEFVNCTTENTFRGGARVYDKAATSARVRFENCSWKTSWLGAEGDDAKDRAPIALQLVKPVLGGQQGNVEFANCYVYDDVDRPAIRAYIDGGDKGLRDVSGTLFVSNPHGARADLGQNPENVSLEVAAPR